MGHKNKISSEVHRFHEELATSKMQHLLIGLSHVEAHGAMAAIKELGMTAATVLTSWTREHRMPLITQMHARWTPTSNTGHMQSSAHLSWQGEGPRPKAIHDSC